MPKQLKMNINKRSIIAKEIRQQLFLLADNKYKSFMNTLIPGCNNIIGIRMPILRKIAKNISQSERISFIQTTPKYFEETMLQGLIIGMEAKKTDDMILIKNFIPKINNWAVCDTFCSSAKFMKSHPAECLQLILPYLKSTSEFEVRFALVSLLNHFTTQKYLPLIFHILDDFNHKGYYAQMSAAWLLSICFIKFPNETTNYIKRSKLNDQTFNRAIQKIIESKQTKKTIHPLLKKLKR